MGTQKLPITKSEHNAIVKEAEKLKGTQKEYVWKAYLLFRFTGMHTSRLISPESKIEELEKDGRIRIAWYRTMKGKNPSKKSVFSTRIEDIDLCLPRSFFPECEFYPHSIFDEKAIWSC